MPPIQPLGFQPEKPVADLAELGGRLTRATGGLRVRAVSWHDADGQVLWSSSPLLGIEQREAIRDALEAFAGIGARMRVDRLLGDNQAAVLLRSADRGGNTLGFAMLLVDSRVLLSKGKGSDMPVPALQIISEFGRLMLARSGGSASQVLRSLEISVPQDEEPTIVTRGGSVTEAEHAMLRELRLALHVQPLLALRANARVRRYEVLLRSQDEHGDSTAAPLEVLEKAASSGLGTVIDRRVVTPLVAWLRRRTDIVESGPCLFSVNLSPNALHDEHFVKWIGQVLLDAGLPRGILAFEIPAKVLARRRTSATRMAQALQAIGCGLRDRRLRHGGVAARAAEPAGRAHGQARSDAHPRRRRRRVRAGADRRLHADGARARLLHRGQAHRDQRDARSPPLARHRLRAGLRVLRPGAARLDPAAGADRGSGGGVRARVNPPAADSARGRGLVLLTERPPPGG
ncbi:MAG: EAL domain-containing protein [Steroidobacteraceae bacterium]